jgi:antitoxin (DNA-binding transcriptional repressor) of toxin-antitoxin stability system
MAVCYISEGEAIRDFAAVLAQVRAGTQVVIEDVNSTIAVVKPVVWEAEEPEPGYDEWFRAEVQQVLDKEKHETISEEDAEAIMAEHRHATLRKLHGSAA